MTRRIAFLCFECCTRFEDIPSIHCEPVDDRITRDACEFCLKTRSGKRFEIISGVKKILPTDVVEPCP